LAAASSDMRMCLISLVDDGRQRFKSHHGLGATKHPREVASCSHAILGDGIMEINDSRHDEQFHDNPLVTGGPRVIFYAGMPLLDLGNNNLSTLCVIDQKPRDLNDHQKQALNTIANRVATNVELRRALNISQKDLDHARHAAKAKSIFTANVSYEIRTP
jgi:GAF domain-containing protein